MPFASALACASSWDTLKHDALRAFLAKKRTDADLTQTALAKRLKRRQDYVSDIETGQKVVTVVELMEWSVALGFDPQAAIRTLKTVE